MALVNALLKTKERHTHRQWILNWYAPPPRLPSRGLAAVGVLLGARCLSGRLFYFPLLRVAAPFRSADFRSFVFLTRTSNISPPLDTHPRLATHHTTSLPWASSLSDVDASIFHLFIFSSFIFFIFLLFPSLQLFDLSSTTLLVQVGGQLRV